MRFPSAACSVFRHRRTFASELALLRVPAYVVSACAIATACSGATTQRPLGQTVSALGAAGPVVGLAQKCLDVRGANTASGTPIQLWDCNGTDAQQWTYSGGQLIGIAGKCLDVQGDNQAVGTMVQLWDCNGTPAQQWSIQDGSLVSSGGFCLDVIGGNSASGTRIDIWGCSGQPNQQWTVAGDTSTADAGSTPTAAGPVVGLAQKCLDDQGANTASGTPIQLWDCNGTDAQQWTYSGGQFIGIAGKCLDVQGDDQAAGTLVQLWDCNGTAAQQWSLQNGSIVSSGGFCLDVTGDNSASGTRIDIWGCNGQANQQWTVAGGTSTVDAGRGVDAGSGVDAGRGAEAGSPPTTACTTLPALTGSTFYVSPNGGGDGSSAQAPTTIAQANQPNATLLLLAGTYPVGSTQINLQSGTTWRPAPGVPLGAAIFDGQSMFVSSSPIMIYGATNVTMYGLGFQNFGTLWDPNQYLNGDFEWSAITVQGCDNVLLDSLSMNNIQGTAAIQVNGADNVTISHNAFDTIAGHSVGSYTTDGGPCGTYCNRNLTIAYNTTTNAVQYGVDAGMIHTDDQSHSATGIKIINNIASGFKPPVPGNASQQIACLYLDDDSSNILVQNNICFGGAGNYYGTLWHGGDHNTFDNNVFDLTGDSSQTIGLYQDIGNTTNYGMGDNIFSHNIVLTNSNAGLWLTCCGAPISYPTFSNNLYWPSFASAGPIIDPSPTVSNPLFTNSSNPSSDNYALSSNSPALPLGFTPIDTSQNNLLPVCP